MREEGRKCKGGGWRDEGCRDGPTSAEGGNT